MTNDKSSEEKACTHELSEKEDACACDALCPICLSERVKEMEKALEWVQEHAIAVSINRQTGVWNVMTWDIKVFNGSTPLEAIQAAMKSNH